MMPAEMEKAARGVVPSAAFKNELTIHSSTAEVPRMLEMLHEAAQVERQHGRDPGTKAQAAAHEAGHIILAHIAGSQVTGARIIEKADRGRRVWVGVTNHTTPDPTGVTGRNGAATVAAAPVCAFRYAVITAAGLAGEIQAGLSHPASSLDEKAMVRRICAELDTVLKVRAGTTLRLAVIFSATALGNYPAQFAAIRGHIERNRRLTHGEASRMLASVKPADLAALLMEGIQ